MQFPGWTCPAYVTSFVGGVRVVLRYLGSVIAFYVWALGPQIFMALVRLFPAFCIWAAKDRKLAGSDEEPALSEILDSDENQAEATDKIVTTKSDGLTEEYPSWYRRKIASIIDAIHGRCVQRRAYRLTSVLHFAKAEE